jgi:hypothetical protein
MLWSPVSFSQTALRRPAAPSRWRLGRLPSTVCAVPEKMLILLIGVVLAAGLGGLAVVGDGPPILACAATLAFVAVGNVMPARGLPLLIVRRQGKPLGVARAAFLFAFLGDHCRARRTRFLSAVCGLGGAGRDQLHRSQHRSGDSLRRSYKGWPFRGIRILTPLPQQGTSLNSLNSLGFTVFRPSGEARRQTPPNAGELQPALLPHPPRCELGAGSSSTAD